MKTIKLSEFIYELELMRDRKTKVKNHDKICFLIEHSKGILSRGDLKIPVDALLDLIKNSK